MLISCIKNRRSIFQFQSKTVPKTALVACLEAAIWAPNHGLTEPWRFYVIGREMHDKLAHIYAQKRAEKRASSGTENFQSVYDHAIKKFLAIPQLVFVGQALNSNAVIAKEDFAACACAIQNFQLAAWEQGLGVQWSTGPILKAPETANLLGIDSNQIELIAALYVGYPKTVPSSTRKDLDCVTQYYD